MSDRFLGGREELILLAVAKLTKNKLAYPSALQAWLLSIDIPLAAPAVNQVFRLLHQKRYIRVIQKVRGRNNVITKNWGLTEKGAEMVKDANARRVRLCKEPIPEGRRHA